MKKSMKCLMACFVMVMAFFVTSIAVQAEAVKPAKPTGLGLYGQNGSLFQLRWNYDDGLPYYGEDGYFGFEILVSTLKGKKIKSVDYNRYSGTNLLGVEDYTYTKIDARITNSKMQKQGFKFKVRSYVHGANGQKLYSDWSKEKVIIPRPRVNKGSVNRNDEVTVKWNKISGAKSYTVYLSSDNGKSFKKIGTTKKTSFTTKSLTKYKDYYLYVTANGVKYKKKKYSSTKPVEKTSNLYNFYITVRYK